MKLVRKGIQPVWLEAEKDSDSGYAFFQQSLDPDYFVSVQTVSARTANNRVDEHFVESGIGNFFLKPGGSRSGFVVTHVDEGDKPVRVGQAVAIRRTVSERWPSSSARP